MWKTHFFNLFSYQVEEVKREIKFHFCLLVESVV